MTAGRHVVPLESESFVSLWQCGIPLPQAQVYVFDANGRFIGVVDALWISSGRLSSAWRGGEPGTCGMIFPPWHDECAPQWRPATCAGSLGR